MKFLSLAVVLILALGSACDAPGFGRACDNEGDCSKGYVCQETDASGKRCLPAETQSDAGIDDAHVDECVPGSGDCDANATCTDTQGRFTCVCDSGFVGDGLTCSDGHRFIIDVSFVDSFNSATIGHSTFDFVVVHPDGRQDSYTSGTEVNIVFSPGEALTIHSLAAVSSDDLFQFCYHDWNLDQDVGSLAALRSAALRSVGNMHKLDYMFYKQSEMTEFSTQADLAQITSIDSTWFSCRSLSSFPAIDTSSVTNMSWAWGDCLNLNSFPAINTSSVTNIEGAWAGCQGLTSFPAVNTGSVTNMNSTWLDCSSLTSFPVINTSSVTNMTSAWEGCSELVCIPRIDTRASTDKSNMFAGDDALLHPNASEQADLMDGDGALR